MANITLSAKEVSDFKSNCDKWSRERAVVMSRAMAEKLRFNDGDINTVMSAGQKVATEFEVHTPFPKLFPDV